MTALQISDSFTQSHEVMKSAIALAAANEAEHAAALDMIRDIPREDVVHLARMAVAQSHTDEIDMLPREDQDRIRFAEDFVLRLLSEEERDQVLGKV